MGTFLIALVIGGALFFFFRIFTMKVDEDQDSEIKGINNYADKVLVETAQSIVSCSLHFLKKFHDQYPRDSIMIGAEVLYLAMNQFDRMAFGIVGSERRDEYYHRLLANSLSEYVSSLVPNESEEVIDRQIEAHYDQCKLRHEIYGKCTSWMGEKGGMMPPAGSTLFAFLYFVHSQIRSSNGETFEGEGERVIPMLIGQEKVTDETLNLLPDFKQIIEWIALITDYLGHWDFKERLESIK